MYSVLCFGLYVFIWNKFWSDRHDLLAPPIPPSSQAHLSKNGDSSCHHNTHTRTRCPAPLLFFWPVRFSVSAGIRTLKIFNFLALSEASSRSLQVEWFWTTHKFLHAAPMPEAVNKYQLKIIEHKMPSHKKLRIYQCSFCKILWYLFCRAVLIFDGDDSVSSLIITLDVLGLITNNMKLQ